jgi:acyl-CoA dehydrogenase
MNDFSQALRSTSEVAGTYAEKADAAAAFPVEALDEMRTTGLLGLLVPGQYGGLGGDLSDLVEATMVLARVDLSVALIFAMHCQQVGTIERYGSEKLKAKVLTGVATGRLYLGSVTTAPGSGGHLLTSDSAARRTGDELLLDRVAPIVTGGRHADAYLVTMGTPDAVSPAQVDLVYADRDQLELEVTGDWRPLGMRATESVPMRLHGTVPDWQVVGARGDFRTIAADYFAPLAHIGWSAAWLGTAAGACSRVLRYVRDPARRKQFDPGSELLLTRLANTRSRLEVVHALLQHTVSVFSAQPDTGAAPVQLLNNTLKLVASEEAFRVVDELVELVGLRHGYLTGSPLRLELAFRDLRSATLNYANDRLRLSNGALTLMDTGVNFA